MDEKTTSRMLRDAAQTKVAWTRAERKFRKEYEDVMRRLFHEAAYNMMSVEQVSAATGLTHKQVRSMMRRFDLNPKHGRKMLSDKAAEALRSNADLLGVKPDEMDLSSPLAYLPMGEQLRKRLVEETTAVVTEVPE